MARFIDRSAATPADGPKPIFNTFRCKDLLTNAARVERRAEAPYDRGLGTPNRRCRAKVATPTPAARQGRRACRSASSSTKTPSIRHFLSLILHGAGIDTEEFADGRVVRPGCRQAQRPTSSSSTSASNPATRSNPSSRSAKRGYFGFVQLMSSRGSAVLEHVKSIGEQHKLQMLPVLKKPFETSAIMQIVQQLKLGHPAPKAARDRPRRSARQELDRVLVSAEDRPAQKAARRRRGLRARPPPATRHPAAGRVHAGRDRSRAGRRCRSWRWSSALKAGLNFRQARRQSAVRGQRPGQRAGQAADPRHRARAPPAARQLAGTDHRRHRRADRQRPRRSPTT